MKEEFSELIQYLDNKFEGVDNKFGKVDQKLLDVDDKLKDLQDNKADKSDVNNLLGAIDAYAKKADAYFQEMVMLAHKVDRHEKWLHQVAEKLGVKLQY